MSKLAYRFPDGPLHAGVVLALGVVLAWAPDHFLTMLARAFLLEWLLVFAGLVVLALVLRRWWMLSAAGASVLLIGLALTRTPSADAGPERSGGLRIAHLNVFQPNRAHPDVIAAARATAADLISFQEVDARWARVLIDSLDAEYPFHRIAPRNDCYGIALFSKRPFLRAEIVRLTDRPVIDAVVEADGGPVRILAVHASSPGSYAEFRDRNTQLDRLAAVVAHAETPVLVVGDLNTVSWDRALQRLCARTGLRESADAPVATWPAVAGFALMPLDHMLVTPTLAIARPRSIRIPGSDHRGLVADITFR